MVRFSLIEVYDFHTLLFLSQIKTTYYSYVKIKHMHIRKGKVRCMKNLKDTYIGTFRELLEKTEKDAPTVCNELKTTLVDHFYNDAGLKLNADMVDMLFAALIAANEHGNRCGQKIVQEESFNKGFEKGCYTGYVAHKTGGDDIAYELTCDYFFQKSDS